MFNKNLIEDILVANELSSQSKVKYLAQGEHSDAYIIETPNRKKLVLRIGKTNEVYKMYIKDETVEKVLNDLNFQKKKIIKVGLFQNKHPYSFSQFINGTTLSNLNDNDLDVGIIMKRLLKLHSTNFFVKGFGYWESDFQTQFISWRNFICECKFERDYNLNLLLDNEFLSSQQYKKYVCYISSLAKFYPESVSLLHGDINKSNLIVSGKQMISIDWALSAVGDFVFDYAKMSEFFENINYCNLINSYYNAKDFILVHLKERLIGYSIYICLGDLLFYSYLKNLPKFNEKLLRMNLLETQYLSL